MTSNWNLRQRPEFAPEVTVYHIQSVDQVKIDFQHDDQSVQHVEPSADLQIRIAFPTKM